MKKINNNRKIILSVIAVALIFFVIAGIFLFLYQVIVEVQDFSTYTNNQYVSLESKFQSYSDSDREFINNSFHQVAECEYPAVFAVFDSDGKILADSRPAFIIDYVSENSGNNSETIIVDAWNCTDAETRKAIIEFVKNCRHGCKLRADFISLCQKGDEYIPVSALLYNGFNLNDGKIAVTFTSVKPTLTVRENVDSGNIISLYGYNKINSYTKEKYFNKLTTQLEAFEKDFTKTHDDCKFNSGGGMKNSNNYQFELHTSRDGVGLCFYYHAEDNMIHRAFVSDNLRFMLVSMGFIFLVFAAVFCDLLIKLNNKNERLAQSRRAFVAAAAHELKTPLAVIANKSECILENVSPEQTAEYVNSIYDESKRMSRMVKTLLQYNKLNSDNAITKIKEKLAPIIAEQTAKFKPLIDAKNITLTETVNENALLECNKELLGIAIDNLLSNAVKFTAENGEIRITATASGRNFSFEVYNSGSSVSSEDAPHIWEELYSGDKARTRGDSSGMGLAICKRIFMLHGFTYGCRNEKDGVTFYFSAHR